MRCSLLTLSSYLDDELDSGRRGEVDAHLVACQRCRHGLGYLEEEMGRVGALAQVHVPDQGMHALMEQLGLIGPGDALPPRASQAPQRSVDNTPPWLTASGSSLAALPWVPRREVGEVTIVDSNQPALPFADVPLDDLLRGDPQRSAEQPAADDPVVELDGRAIHEAAVPPVEPASDSPDWPADQPQTSHRRGFEEASRSGPHPTAEPDQRASVASPLLRDQPVRPAPQPEWLTQQPAGMQSVAAPIPPPATAPTARTPGVMPPPPLAPEAFPAPVASRPAAPPRRAGDLDDDDPWSWAPRDSEVPRGPRAAAPPPARAWQQPPDAAFTESGADLLPDKIAPLTKAPLAAPSSPLSRIRDQVTLRLALARGGRRGGQDEGVQIVSGLGAPPRGGDGRRPPRRSRMEPSARSASPIESGGPIAAAARSHDLDLPEAPHGSFGERVTTAREADPFSLDGAVTGDAWKQPGRHSRALADRGSPLRRLRLDAATTSLTAVASKAVERGRGVLGHPRQRWFAVAGIAALLLLVLTLSLRSAGSHAPNTSSQPASAANATSSRPSAHATSAPAATAPAAVRPPVAPPASAAPQPALPAGQTFGGGGQGWQVQRLRYGNHPNDLRVVFDLGAASGSATTAPTTVISFADAKTMLVTFSGVLPAGSTGSLPDATVVTGVSQTRSGAQTVFQFNLARPVTPSGLFVAGPLRFVLDLQH